MSAEQSEANNINFEKWVKQLDRMDEEKFTKKVEEHDRALEEIEALKQELAKAQKTIEEQAKRIKELESSK